MLQTCLSLTTRHNRHELYFARAELKEMKGSIQEGTSAGERRLGDSGASPYPKARALSIDPYLVCEPSGHEVIYLSLKYLKRFLKKKIL